jgi:hypothetical protein
MASYLIDKLEALKTNELEIKEQQRILEEEIAFEMEKQRRLEMEGTITKLRTQIGEFSKNIEGLIMPNNIVSYWCPHVGGGQNNRRRKRKGQTNDQPNKRDDPQPKNRHKIYDDIIPLFTTIMGIMKKQEEEIKKLKSNI